MSTPPDFDKSKLDSDQMFDFLQEEANGQPARVNKPRSRKKIAMPIIRKPVPISESGPARVGAGTPNIQQTQHTQVTPLDDDLDFLNDAKPPQRRVSVDQDEAWNAGVHVGYEEPQASFFKKYGLPLLGLLLLVGGALGYLYLQQVSPPVTPLTSVDDESGVIVPTEPVATNEPVVSNERTETDSVTQQPIAPANTLFDRFNEKTQLLETLIADGQLDEAEQIILTMDRTVYGYGAIEFGEFEQQIARLRTAGTPNDTDIETVAEATQVAELAREQEAQRLAELDRLAEAQRIVEQARAEEQARLAEEAQIAEQARLAEEARVAEQTRLAEEAQIAEQARLAEAAQVAEQARLAEEAQTAEQARLAEEARVAEQARLAEEARLAEQTRLAEEARLAEQARIAEEARLAEAAQIAEQARLAEASRAAELAEQQRLAEIERQEAAAARAATAAALAAQQAQETELSLALATAKAQERLDEQNAAQRETERRLAERERLSRERAQAAEFARRQAVERENRRRLADEAQANLQITPSPRTESITDDDFNFVAGKFVELKNAVTNRDINAVIALTEPSGKRIQEMLQIFQNSSTVSARISNVASRNADGIIVGQLKIEKLVKNSGAVSAVPSSLSSITLTSERGPSGWSAIAW